MSEFYRIRIQELEVLLDKEKMAPNAGRWLSRSMNNVKDKTIDSEQFVQCARVIHSYHTYFSDMSFLDTIVELAAFYTDEID